MSRRALVTAGNTNGDGDSQIKDYSKYLSPTSQKRQPSAIRRLQPLVSKPNMISLGGGLPNKGLFPVNQLSFGMENYDQQGNITQQQIELSPEELDLALQYSPTQGLPKLVQQLQEIQTKEHEFNAATQEVMVTVGSQDGFCKSIEMLIEPNSNDVVFCESPTYSGALAFLQPYCGNQLVPIETDRHGLIPASLEQALQQQQQQQQQSCRKVLYTIPTAQNPSGATLIVERRHQVMELAHQYDIIILEDDPYYFLHPQRQELPSLLSLDSNGRVLRFDSVSKLISAGMRIGFVTGPKTLLEKLQFHIQATNLHNSGLSQIVLSKILEEWQNNNGFDKHCHRVAQFYDQRKQVMVQAANKHLTGIAEWHVPEAGMFLWMKLPFQDTKALIEDKAAEANVLLVPGQAFDPLDQASSHVRASFSTASDEDLDTAMQRLADLIRSEMS